MKNDDYRQSIETESYPRISSLFPWADLLENGCVLTKDSKLLCTYLVTLPDNSLSDDTTEEASRRIALWLQGQETGATYFFDLIRRPAFFSFSGVSPSFEGVNAEIEEHRQKIFSNPKINSRNIWYFSVCVDVAIDENGILHSDLERCEKYFTDLENTLSASGAKYTRLTSEGDISYERNMLSFLATCASSKARALKSPKELIGISDFIATENLDIGQPLVLGDKYLQPLTIHVFPSETFASMLFNLTTLPFHFRWSTRFTPLSNMDSQERAKKIRAKNKAMLKSWKTVLYEQTTQQETNNLEAQAVTDTQETEEVLDSLTKGETLGSFTSVILLTADSLDELRKMQNAALESLKRSGFGAKIEGLGAKAAWLGTLPGDTKNNLSKPWLTASNLSQIVPFSAIYHGSQTNRHLLAVSGNGTPHVVGKTVTGELYFLNLNGPTDDVGHTFIIGSTGAGKSVLLALLGSQWLRYPGSRVILFDKDFSFRNICEASGGAVYIPTAEDSDLSFMPLSRIRTKPEQAIEWVEIAVISQGVDVTPEMSKDIAAVCRSWDDAPATLQRFTQRLRGYNPASGALPALERLLEDRALSLLFGGESDEFNLSSFRRMTMIEMGKLMELGDKAVLPTLQFLFSRIDELFDKEPKPTLLILDEAWKFLSHVVFRKKIKEWLKTLRKKNVFVIFALQNINDIDDAEEFLTSCHTRIFTPNSDLSEKNGAVTELYRKIGLTEGQIDTLAMGVRKRDYMIVQSEGSCLVDFCIDAFQLKRLARDGR